MIISIMAYRQTKRDFYYRDVKTLITLFLENLLDEVATSKLIKGKLSRRTKKKKKRCTSTTDTDGKDGEAEPNFQCVDCY